MTAKAIVRTLLEADEPDPSELAASIQTRPEVFTLGQIKSAVPEFFSRANNKAFGTVKTYFYQPGNYVVLQNVSYDRYRQRKTDYVVYQFVRYGPDARSSDLMWRGTFKDIVTARNFTKEHFRNPRLTDDEFLRHLEQLEFG